MRSDPTRRPGASLLVVPWLAYLGITVLEPFAHGAYRRDGFWEHTAITFALSGLLMGAWVALARLRATPRLRAEDEWWKAEEFR